MKYLIVSDNHRDSRIVSDLVHIYEDEVDGFIHCGDSELAADDKVWKHYAVVKGNNDYGKHYAKEIVDKIGDYTFYLTHGHKMKVRRSLSELTLKAKELGADFAFFGHTHIPTIEKVNGVWAINPGSIERPRQADGIKTYIILSLENDGKFTAQIYDHNHHTVPDKRFVYDI